MSTPGPRSADPPTNVRAHQADQILELSYSDLGEVRIPYRSVRAICPCAVCQNEWTGERILDPSTIRVDIRIEGMDPVGSYAVRFRWNDGHNTGIYSYGLLRELAQQHGSC